MYNVQSPGMMISPIKPILYSHHIGSSNYIGEYAVLYKCIRHNYRNSLDILQKPNRRNYENRYPVWGLIKSVPFPFFTITRIHQDNIHLTYPPVSTYSPPERTRSLFRPDGFLQLQQFLCHVIWESNVREGETSTSD